MPNTQNIDPCFQLSNIELAEIKKFHRYCMYNAGAYCGICLKKLYPDQVMIWPKSSEITSFPCTEWGHPPLDQWPESWIEADQLYEGHQTAHQLESFIVCKNCEKNAKPPFPNLKYPGKYKIT